LVTGVQVIPTELVDYIKELLISDPVDIYSEEEETVNESNFELVEPRTNDFGRYIGSANIFISAFLVCDEATNGESLNNLTDVNKRKFETEWVSLLDLLKTERFIREKQQLAHSKIKLVVDNDRLPTLGA
jgi:hypothetical protein